MTTHFYVCDSPLVVRDSLENTEDHCLIKASMLDNAIIEIATRTVDLISYISIRYAINLKHIMYAALQLIRYK